MFLSFAYLAFSAVLQLLVGRRRTSSPKTSSFWCCVISFSCSGGKRLDRRCGRPIVPFSLRSPGNCRRGGDTRL